MNEENGKIYSFDSFQVDPVRRRLTRDGEPVPIHSKTFDLLLALIENRGRVIEKDELLGLVWANQIVEEGNLTVKMSALRKALGERKDEARFIVTIPGKGYRFVADVRQIDSADDDTLIIERHAVTHITVEEETELDVERPPAPEAGANGLIRRHDAAVRATTAASSPQAAPASLTGRREIKTRSRRVVIAWTLIAVFAVLAAFGYWFTRSRQTENAVLPFSFQQAAFKRLTTSGRIAGAIVSPDGKYFVYAQREEGGQSLWVRQVAESRSIQIMPTRSIEYWGLTFTPDGTHIYCTVFTPNKSDSEMWRVPVLGGAVERLPTTASGGVTFSPDGKRFAYVRTSTKAGGTMLRIADADGGNERMLTLIRHPNYFMFPEQTVSWSADGEWLACATKVVDETGDYGTVMGVRVRDGSMSPVPKRRFQWVESVAWLPGGKGLLITASETAAAPLQLWQVSFPAGEAQKLSNDLNRYSWAGITADGARLLTVQRTTASSLWVAEYEPEEHKVGTPARIADETIAYGEIAWTPEGKIIHRSGASGSLNLWMTDADGGNPTQLTKDALPDKGLSISPDGRYIVFSSFRAGKHNLWRVAADGGNLTRLTDGAGELYPRVTPDSRWIIYQQGAGQTTSTLWRLPIEGGKPEQITKTHATFPALAPNGRFVAHFYMSGAAGEARWHIGVVEVETGRRAFSFPIPDDMSERVVRWTPDGESLLYAKTNGETGSLWRQPLDGSPPAPVLRSDAQPVDHFAWSPDGGRLAFTGSSETSDAVLIQARPF